MLALPPERKDLKLLVTEDNLKRVGIFTDKVGTLIPFYKFRNGVPLNYKPHDQVEIDGDSCDSDREPTVPGGKARP